MSKMSELSFEVSLSNTTLRASHRIAELENVLRELLNEVIPDTLRDCSPIVRNAEDILEKDW